MLFLPRTQRDASFWDEQRRKRWARLHKVSAKGKGIKGTLLKPLTQKSDMRSSQKVVVIGQRGRVGKPGWAQGWKQSQRSCDWAAMVRAQQGKSSTTGDGPHQRAVRGQIQQDKVPELCGLRILANPTVHWHNKILHRLSTCFDESSEAWVFSKCNQ